MQRTARRSASSTSLLLRYAAGPIVSDSSLQKAWIIPETVLTNDGNQVLAFNENTFIQAGSIIVNGTSTGGYGLNAVNLVRWGQNGLAFNTPTQIYVLQSPVVKDLSQSPADLAVTIQAQGTATTGASVTYSITVTNNGPNTAQGVSLSATLADSFSYQNATTTCWQLQRLERGMVRFRYSRQRRNRIHSNHRHDAQPGFY